MTAPKYDPDAVVLPGWAADELRARIAAVRAGGTPEERDGLRIAVVAYLEVALNLAERGQS